MRKRGPLVRKNDGLVAAAIVGTVKRMVVVMVLVMVVVFVGHARVQQMRRVSVAIVAMSTATDRVQLSHR